MFNGANLYTTMNGRTYMLEDTYATKSEARRQGKKKKRKGHAERFKVRKQENDDPFTGETTTVYALYIH